MDTTVKHLVERFNNGTATPDERLELLRLVQRGQHADLFGDALEARILYYLENPHLLDLTDDDDRRAIPLEQASRAFVMRHTQSGFRSLTPYWPWLAAAAVMIFIITTFYFIKHSPDAATLATNTPATLHAPSIKTFSGRQWIHLPDGSTALLNDNSQLQYDSTFNNTNRTVTLTGEAFFDVTHDPARPFNVRSGAVTTQVLGTAFNIRAYPDQKNITVVVSRGKVKVSDAHNKELAIITKQQQLSVNAADTRIYSTEAVVADNAIAWKKDFLVLNGITMREAKPLIESKYNITIEALDSAFSECVIDAAFIHNETLEQVLTVVSKVFHGSYTVNQGVVTINGSCQ